MIAPASRKLGKYDIRQKLGRGGMADVYLAQDMELGYMVALKLIEHSADPDTIASIEAERRGSILQARLAEVDPRVVRVYGAGDLEHYFCVAMEYIDGQDLAELMRHGKLELEFAIDVALAVAQTLDHAHKLEATIDGKSFHGIVHGDIKPKNIRIDARGQVRVLDFGIAKALSLSRRLTRNEFGSVPYASPERLESGEVNFGSDLWSLSVMLYEMVTGMQPYNAESTERMERMIRSGIAPPPAPDPCPEALRRILIKAMAPNPELRYASAAALGTDLAAFRAGGQVEALNEDLDATRRTFHPPAVDDETRRTSDETRRTVASPPSQTAPAQWPVSRPKERSNLFYYSMRAIALLVLATVLYALWAGIQDYRLYERGLRFEHDVLAEQITDPNQIWDRWTELSNGNPSSLFLSGPRKAVRDKFVAAANQVIDTYRDNDAKPVYENEWRRAQTMLLHALSVDPNDQSLHGKLRLCEGHVARINGAKHKSAAELNTAIQEFNDAQQAMPRSPDPALGLARVYVSLKDVDKEATAFHQAEMNGYTLGNRERAQLADGYRERADRTFWDTRNFRGLPQEKDQVQQAANDYQRALDLYQRSAGWGDSTTRVSQVEASLESVNTRLQQIAEEQGQGGETAKKHGKVASAIIGLIDALRDKKSTKKDDH